MATPTIRKRPRSSNIQKNIEAALREYDELKREAARASEAASEKQTELLALLDAAEKKSASVALDDGTKVTATVVRGERYVINEDKLKKRVGSQMWNKITTRILDKKKLDAYVKAGDITNDVIAEVHDVYENKPYIRMGRK